MALTEVQVVGRWSLADSSYPASGMIVFQLRTDIADAGNL
jgi:hypothetical protein